MLVVVCGYNSASWNPHYMRTNSLSFLEYQARQVHMVSDSTPSLIHWSWGQLFTGMCLTEYL